MKRVILGCLPALAILASFAVPGPVLAFDVFGGACGTNGGSSSAVCSNTSTSNPLTGSNGLLLKIAEIFAVLAGITAIIVIIVSGFTLIASGGDAAKAKSARSAIIGAVIGLVIIALAATIVSFVLGNL